MKNENFNLNTRQVTVTETPSFKMSIKVNDMLLPSDTKAVYWVREEFDKDGNQINESVYEFFLNPEEMNTVSKFFTNIN
jgi:hypothetical protein